MKKLLLAIIFVLPIFGWAQGGAVDVGYAYFHRSALYTGYDYRISDENKAAFNMGAGAYFTSLNENFTVLPEGHISYGSWIQGEVSATNKNIIPSFGLNLLNFIQVKFGKSFGYKKDSGLDGFFFGLNVMLGGESGRGRHYDSWIY